MKLQFLVRRAHFLPISDQTIICPLAGAPFGTIVLRHYECVTKTTQKLSRLNLTHFT